MYARIEDNIVKEIFLEKPEFHPDLMKDILLCPNNVTEGMEYKNGSFSQPKPIQKPEPEPSELEIKIAAIEKKLSITKQDLDDARNELIKK